MNCLQCQHIVSRNAAMTRQGFSGCKNHPEWEFRATTKERVCPSFVRAPDDVLAKREELAGEAA